MGRAIFLRSALTRALRAFISVLSWLSLAGGMTGAPGYRKSSASLSFPLIFSHFGPHPGPLSGGEVGPHPGPLPKGEGERTGFIGRVGAALTPALSPGSRENG